MGAARKLREQDKPVQLKPLRTIEKDKNKPIKSFITLVLIFATLIVGLSVHFNANEEENETLEGFIKKSIEDKSPEQKKFKLGKTTAKQIEKIKELTGLDVTSHIWIIENFAVRHIFRRHPETKIEDLKRLYSLLNDFDNMKEVSFNKKSVPEIEINKVIENKMFRLFLEIRKRELSITTLYKNKIKKPE